MNRKNESLRITEDVQCRYRALQKNGVRLIWELTGRCNLHCRHCFAGYPLCDFYFGEVEK